MIFANRGTAECYLKSGVQLGPNSKRPWGWNILKYSLNRWLSHKVHNWATILRFLPTIWFLEFRNTWRNNFCVHFPCLGDLFYKGNFYFCCKVYEQHCLYIYQFSYRTNLKRDQEQSIPVDKEIEWGQHDQSWILKLIKVKIWNEGCKIELLPHKINLCTEICL